MNPLINSIQSLGLSDKEAKVYLANLELGSTTVQELARRSGVKRTSIYNFLDEMVAKGFVSKIERDGKILIIPEKPETIVAKSKKQAEVMQGLLPELLSIFNVPGDKPKVRFYEGVEGIKKVYDELLTTDQPIYGFSDYEKMFDLLDQDYIEYFPTERANRNIKFFSITKDGPIARKVKMMDAKHLRETKLVKNVAFETEINISGDKVAMLSFRKPGAGVIIEDKAISQTMRSIWDFSWNSLK